jgi:hypothetical protein
MAAVSEQLEIRRLLSLAPKPGISPAEAHRLGEQAEQRTEATELHTVANVSAPKAASKGVKPTAGSSGVLIDHGGLGFDRYQIGSRWSSTANGGTGAQGSAITLTWSIVPDGTTLTSGAGEPNTPSDFRARMNAIYGNMTNWLPIVTQVFQEWSDVSGVTYIYEPNDDGVQMAQFNTGINGVRGDVRIGAHNIDGGFNILAYNYFPNFGDMTIDSSDISPGGFMFGTANNSRALRNVMAHEHGHGLGFNHVDPINGTKLMEAFASTGFDGPQLDDILAVNRNYGDIYEKAGANNTFSTAVDRGTLADGTNTVSMVSIANTSDQDYFKFNIPSNKPVRVTVSPQGFTYLQGPQGGTTTSFNAKAQMDLQFQLIASDGTTVLQTVNATTAGNDESFTNVNLPAGTYYVRVTPAPGAANSAQMYNLTTLVGQAAVPLTDQIDPVTPTPRTTPVSSIGITFSEAIDPASFTLDDLSMTRDTLSESLAAQGATLTSGDNIHWTLGNLDAATDKVGSFVVNLGTDIQTGDGRSVASGQSVSWQMTAINGTEGNDDIRVARAAGFDNLAAVYFNGSPTEAYLFSIASPLNVLTINGKGGDDRITLDYTFNSMTPSGGITIDGGAGNDTLAARGSTGTDGFTANATTLRRSITSSVATFSNVEGLDMVRGKLTMTADVGGLNLTLEDGVTGFANASQHLGALDVQGTAALTVTANGGRFLSIKSLALDPTAGLIDLNDNDLLVDYTGASPLATIQGLINTGRNGGDWQSFLGLSSTAAGNNAAHNTTLGAMESGDYLGIYGPGAKFDGESLDNSVVLVKYTYYGDSDFNGKVNFDDYVHTDNGFNNHQTGWSNGDFNGDGQINFDDYVLIDLAFNTQTTVL